MTTEQAAGKLLDLIKARGPGVSFVELQEVLGEEGRGNLSIEIGGKNILLWVEMSALFIDALESLRERIEPTDVHPLVYLCDGTLPFLPLAKRNVVYKKPHWLPVTWRLKKTA